MTFTRNGIKYVVNEGTLAVIRESDNREIFRMLSVFQNKKPTEDEVVSTACNFAKILKIGDKK